MTGGGNWRGLRHAQHRSPEHPTVDLIACRLSRAQTDDGLPERRAYRDLSSARLSRTIRHQNEAIRGPVVEPNLHRSPDVSSWTCGSRPRSMCRRHRSHWRNWDGRLREMGLQGTALPTCPEASTRRLVRCRKPCGVDGRDLGSVLAGRPVELHAGPGAHELTSARRSPDRPGWGRKDRGRRRDPVGRQRATLGRLCRAWRLRRAHARGWTGRSGS